MDKYINVELLIKAGKKAAKNTNDYAAKVAMETMEKLIDIMPAADVVEVKHGYWEFTGRKLTCSVCGHKAYMGTDDKGLLKEEAALKRYCFHCGAKMDGEINER